MWKADGIWNMMRNVTQTTCHQPIWPISSDIASPVSSKPCDASCWSLIWCFSALKCPFDRVDSDVILLLALPPPLFNGFSSCRTVSMHALLLVFTKFSRSLNTVCQKLVFFNESLSKSLSESDGAISMWESRLAVSDAVSIVPDAANSTFCRRFSPEPTKPSLCAGSEAILIQKHKKHNTFSKNYKQKLEQRRGGAIEITHTQIQLNFNLLNFISVGIVLLHRHCLLVVEWQQQPQNGKRNQQRNRKYDMKNSDQFGNSYSLHCT